MFSGDEVADQTARAAFLIAYDLKHQIVKKDDSRADLVVGNNDWQLPISLVQKPALRRETWRPKTTSALPRPIGSALKNIRARRVANRRISFVGSALPRGGDAHQS